MREVNFKKVGLFTGLGVLAGYLYCRIDKNIYIAHTEANVEWKTLEKTQIENPKVKEILRQGFGKNLLEEQELILSQPLFSKALGIVSKKLNRPYLLQNFNDLYSKYHVEPKQNTRFDSPVLKIRVETGNKDLSLTLAQAIVETYHELRNQAAYSTAEEAIKYLETEIGKIGSKNNTSAEIKVAEPKKDQSPVYQLLGQAKQDLQKTEQNLLKSKEKVQNLSDKIKNLIATEKKDKAALNNNPIIQMVEAQLSENKHRKEELIKENPTPDPQLLESINKTIQDLENNLKQLKSNQKDLSSQRNDLDKQLQAAKLDHEYLEQQLKVIKEQVTLYENQVTQLPKESGQALLTQRESLVPQEQYKWLTSELEKVKEYMVLVSNPLKAPLPNVTKENLHTLPTSIVLILGGVIGAALGLTLSSFYRKSIDDLKPIEKGIEETTEFSVLASSPHITNEMLNHALDALKTTDFTPLENFQSMVKKIDFHREQKASVSLLFTSPKNPLDSIYTALHTGFVYAKKGEKVLIVDTNSQKGSLTYLVSSEKERGICEWTLAGCLRNDIEDYVLKTEHQTLEIIPYGKVVSAYITTVEIELMIKTLRNYADVVIFVAPPCSTNKIISTFAKNVDFVCLTTAATKNNNETQEACSSLKKPNPESNILILTGVETSTHLINVK